MFSNSISTKEDEILIQVLQSNKGATGWNLTNLKGMSLSYYMQKLLVEDDYKPIAQPNKTQSSYERDNKEGSGQTT